MSGINRQVRKHLVQASQDSRITRHSLKRLFGKRKQAVGMEAGGKSLQAHRGNLPVTVTPRTPEQVDLPLGALNECRTQFADKLRVVSGRSGEICVE